MNPKGDEIPASDPGETRIDGGAPGREIQAPGRLPESIGEYRILGVLGRGGMGIVYEAEQQTPRRTVALKVVRSGRFVDDQILRLFQREADSLARLKHPNIAAIYETGRTEEGEHFFAMELVRGRTLDVWAGAEPCRDQAGIARRLGLFRDLCDAVNYAHQRGVIHRDLKPSNIVVTEEGGAPEVKVLDFGLARITDVDVAAATMLTEVGMIRGTLPYMSPEQARGDPDALDLRTDVYSLGVVLYELLTSTRPYDTGQTSLVQAVRVICEQPPRSLQSAAPGGPRFDTDLETIVSKALEKDADRRYASAAALSEDLGRYLTSQPILARPASTLYQLRKLVARNKAPAVLAAALLMSVLAFGVGMAVLYARSERNRVEAVRQAKIASAVNEFLNEDLLSAADPDRNPKKEVSMKEVLEEAAKRIRGRFPDDPLVAAAVHQTLGSTFDTLGLDEKAGPQLREALAIRTRELGPEAPETLRTASAIGYQLYHAAKYADAEAILKHTADAQARILGPDHKDTLETLTLLGPVLYVERKYDEAEKLERGVLETASRTIGEDSEPALSALNTLGMVTQDTGRQDEAIAILERLVATQKRRMGEDTPVTLQITNNLAQAYLEKGDDARAEALTIDVLERARRVLGNDHPVTQTFVNNLAIAYRRVGKLDLAEKLYEEGWASSRRTMGEESPPTLISAVNLCRFYVFSKRCGNHLAFLDRTAALHLKVLGPDHPFTALALQNQGECRLLLGRFTEAEPFLVKAEKAMSQSFAPDDPRVLGVRKSLARARARR